MNISSDTLDDPLVNPAGGAPSLKRRTRPFFWSVRRELWENRSIYLAPLSVAAIVLLGFAMGSRKLPDAMRMILMLEPDQQRMWLERPYALCAVLIIITASFVNIFYCLDALYGERRDRSILFWKSLPVSDLTTVLAKATIPLVIIPVVTLVVTVVLQALLLLFGAAVVAAHGVSIDPIWTIHLVQLPLLLVYSLVVAALWYAPVYAWLLLVSAWAKRGPFLWAVLPPIGLIVMEKLALNTSYFAKFLHYRLAGNFSEGFQPFDPGGNQPGGGALQGSVMDQLNQVDPIRFLTSVGLWTGLAGAVALFAAIIWLRRYREPI
jgi:ABC-2 type transport system permease protein